MKEVKLEQWKYCSTKTSQTKESERERDRKRKKKNAYESALLLLCYSLTGEGKKSRIKSECLYFILGFKLNAPLFFFRIFVSIFNNAFHIFLKFSERFKKREERNVAKVHFASLFMWQYHCSDFTSTIRYSRAAFLLFSTYCTVVSKEWDITFFREYTNHLDSFIFHTQRNVQTFFRFARDLLGSLMNVFGVHNLNLCSFRRIHSNRLFTN